MSQPSDRHAGEAGRTPEDMRFRQQMADRMHDQLQQLLSAARMKVGLIRRQPTFDPTTREAIHTVERLLEEAMAESASIISQLKGESA